MNCQGWILVSAVVISLGAPNSIPATADGAVKPEPKPVKVDPREKDKDQRAAGAKAVPKGAKVGQIIIVGNEVTRQGIILDRVPLFPGAVLRYPDLRQAEKNLRRTKLFAAEVSILDPDTDTEYKDILIAVREQRERIFVLKCLMHLEAMSKDTPLDGPLTSMAAEAVDECVVRVMERIPFLSEVDR